MASEDALLIEAERRPKESHEDKLQCIKNKTEFVSLELRSREPLSFGRTWETATKQMTWCCRVRILHSFYNSPQLIFFFLMRTPNVCSATGPVNAVCTKYISQNKDIHNKPTVLLIISRMGIFFSYLQEISHLFQEDRIQQ